MPFAQETVSRRMFFGWHVVGAAFTVAIFAWGIGFYGPPIFLETLHNSRGWPISLISAAMTTHFLLGALIVANLATLHRRYGIPAITATGAVLTALGLLGWAFAGEPWQLFAATPLSGAGWAMTSGAALNAMVSPWFVRRRPAALSMAFNGASMGGVIFSPLWVALIATLGFPWAAAVVAAVATLILWLVATRYLTRTPASMGLLPDGDVDHAHGSTVRKGREHATPLDRAWRDRRFATLAAASSLGLFAQIGLIAHLFSLLVPPLGEAGAGATMGLTTACAIGGRTVLGMIMRPNADRRVVAALNVTLQACGSVALILAAGHSVPLLLLGCLLFGLGLGNVTSLPPLIAQAEFAPADVQRVVALVTAFSQASYAFAPVAFGALRDLGQTAGMPTHAGSAPLLFGAAALIQFAAASATMLGRSPLVPRFESLA
ncbi:MAG TPA: MFS transporter [Acetobacteraceae bacterium]|nr:MFS transporter [Acetobacteraceae bacterium]